MEQENKIGDKIKIQGNITQCLYSLEFHLVLGWTLVICNS